MRSPTPNDIEIILGLAPNSLVISETRGVYTFNQSLTDAQKAIAISTLQGGVDETRPITPPANFSGFARIVERSSFWKGKIRKTLQDKAFTELVNMMGVVAIAGTTPERMLDLLSLWNEVVTSLSVGVAIAPADVTFLNTTATSNRVPLTFASNGTASLIP